MRRLSSEESPEIRVHAAACLRCRDAVELNRELPAAVRRAAPRLLAMDAAKPPHNQAEDFAASLQNVRP